jgi:uncharacterized repeat protein (TIGR01451 family)
VKFGTGSSFAHDAFQPGDTGVQVTLAENQYSRITFNNTRLYTISGKKTNETGTAKAGWKINLTGTTFQGASVFNENTTGSDGGYSFIDLLPGSYNITEETRPGWEPVGAASQTFDLVTSRNDLNFVNRVVSGLSISGKKTNETGAAKADWKITLTGADYIREETKAEGLNDMSTNLSFQGKARLRAISQPDNGSQLDLDEEYVGSYAITRKVHLGGVSRFDRPHLTLNKTGRILPQTTVADYTITVLNDGNAALGPVYVWDIFPAGTDYLNASLKPTALARGYANWSLLYLGIGQSVNINLRLNVTDQQDELVNVVYASGGHNDQWVSAGNMSVMQFGWLGCCSPQVLVEKQARIDAEDSSLIWYRILLKNGANVSLVAQVTDALPAGLQLLNASAEPQVQGQNLVWVTAAIPAGESRFIEYRAQATENGKFVNTARVEAHARDGSGGATAAASATVTVGEATSYAEDGWRPPQWGLDRSEMICDEGIAGEGASCATGSCPV